MDNTYNFNWQAQDYGSFASWLLPHIFAEDDFQDGVMEEVSLASDHFRDVKIGIIINGIEIDGNSFINGLDKVIESCVKSEAQEMFRNLSELSEIQEQIQRLSGYINRAVDDAANALGIVVSSWD